MKTRRAQLRTSKITVLLPHDEFSRFDAYCAERGFKKSTLIARLIRDHLDREGFAVQQELLKLDMGPGSEE